MKYELPSVPVVRDIRLGKDMSFDAWWYTFKAENNIEYSINPGAVAGSEQLRFMVALEPDQIYVPCSDAMFQALIHSANTGEMPFELRRGYARIWRLAIGTVLRLTGQHPDKEQLKLRRRMTQFCRHRLRSSLALGNILPARLTKRLISTILSQNNQVDPWEESKRTHNKAMAEFLCSPEWLDTIGQLPPDVTAFASVPEMRNALNMEEVARLLLLASFGKPGLPPEFADAQAHRIAVDAMLPLLGLVIGHARTAPNGEREGKTLLFVGDSEGGTLADIALLKALVRQGHRVVLALKDMPLFVATTFWECETDPAVAEATRGAALISEAQLSKNALLHRLSHNPFLVINDGTGELLNLYRTSVTFARAWKECDAIILKGRRQTEQLLGSSTEFTRDILCFWRDVHGAPHLHLRPRSDTVVQFSETALNAHADAIIDTMRQARAEGKTVMFYSCIIGSVPGETQTAIRVATEFVAYLRERLDQVLIINPAEHFVPGMDADDLMFMWERVQRSGLIQTWRFQTADDIEQSFALMGQKVPPIWAGKDATYSTGCTKEMRIALDMQRTHPEMQILGPAVDKFFRRNEYGVGKFHDAILTDM